VVMRGSAYTCRTNRVTNGLDRPNGKMIDMKHDHIGKVQLNATLQSHEKILNRGWPMPTTKNQLNVLLQIGFR